MAVPTALGPGALPDSVHVREVGPRDGLQSERPADPRRRAELVKALRRAGCRHVEAVSFVSETVVPAMAGAREVLAAAGTAAGTVTAALVPNLHGARAALEAGVDELTFTLSASAAYNERNVRRTIDESVNELAGVAELASQGDVPVDVVVSCAFGSPYEGDIPATEVAELARRSLDAGGSAMTLADTTGMATPRVLSLVLEALGSALPRLAPGLHLHETRGTALLNAYAAMQLGVARFDASVGGLGGSPFAPGAGGNLATEDFVALLDDLGVETGIDLTRLLDAAALAEQLVGHELPSKVSKAGGRLTTRGWMGL